MFKAIGFVLALYALSVIMSEAFVGFEKALIATFQTLETAAVVSEQQLTHFSD